MISNHLSMVEALRPASNELAHDIEEFLSNGGAIQVLEGPNFRPPPVRHHPAQKPRKEKTRACIAEPVKFLDKMALRDIERDERKVMREKAKADELEYIRGLAETMTYTQAILRTGMHLRTLNRLAEKGGFKFQRSDSRSNKDLRLVDEERDARNAGLIREFLARGFSRNQARESTQTTLKSFERLLEKFGIDYPKDTKGPAPAFFPKQAQQ